MNDNIKSANLGPRLRGLRKQHGWTLRMVSAKTGLAQSTLSKVERNQVSLGYENLIKLSEGLGLDIAELFVEGTPVGTGRRTITRRGEGRHHPTPNYDYEMLCGDLSRKRMFPLIVRMKSRSFSDFEDFVRHEGEEFTYVLEGAIEVHTEFYEPVVLEAGDNIYLDSTMGHAYISVSDTDAMVLGISSHLSPALSEATSLNRNALYASRGHSSGEAQKIRRAQDKGNSPGPVKVSEKSKK